MSSSTVATRYWHRTGDGRVQCDVCPRACRLREGQRGFCFVRMRQDDAIVLTTYGRSSGYCVDPIEKKPLHHFLPGSPVLSFGTAGCNLGCRFCQNWDISTSRETDTLADAASPEAIARAAADLGCRSVAFTYNDPVIFLEYAIDVADACRAAGLKTVAVTAGYICPQPRAEFFRHIDAVNVDLKGFTGDFYHRVCLASLGPVLETLQYLVHQTRVWVEITNLVIPGVNDSDAEISAMTRWVAGQLGPDVPMHFTAFHPDFKMTDRPPTPPATLARAPADRSRHRHPPRLHRQHPRPGWPEHLLPSLRHADDRARLVPPGRLPAHPRGPVQQLRHTGARCVRHHTRNMGTTAPARPARARAAGPALTYATGSGSELAVTRQNQRPDETTATAAAAGWRESAGD